MRKNQPALEIARTCPDMPGHGPDMPGHGPDMPGHGPDMARTCPYMARKRVRTSADNASQFANVFKVQTKLVAKLIVYHDIMSHQKATSNERTSSR